MRIVLLFLEMTHLSRDGNLFGVEVRRLAWFLVPLIHYVWTVGKSWSVINREINQEKWETWGRAYMGDIKGGSREYKMSRNF